MIKLNNKGFAVSTILYGILSLTILILMLIFGIMKSSKDMNQELVESIEDRTNKCVLSEVKLEECYFNGGNCDATEYNSCIDKKIEINRLYDMVEVGDYVNYDAGHWPATVDVAKIDSYAFGGYEAGKSRNDSVLCIAGQVAKYNGWRVLNKSDNVVTLIHAGISECYNHPNADKSAYLSYHLLTGTAYNDEYLSDTVRNWSDYVNADFASSARSVQYSDVSASTVSLVAVGASYITTDIGKPNPLNSYMRGISNDGRVDYSHVGLTGIRPIVELKEDVKTTGFVNNTYGKREWILVK